MRRQSPLMWGLAVLVLVAGTMTLADSGFGEEHDKLEMAATAKVTIEDAIKTATGKVSGKVIEAELENKHNTLVWEVEIITPDNTVKEVHIDAVTGAVIDVEEEKEKSGRFKRPRSGAGAAGAEGK